MNFANFTKDQFYEFISDISTDILCDLSTFICYKKTFIVYRDEYLKRNNYTPENYNQLEYDENYKTMCYIVLTIQNDFNSEFTNQYDSLDDLLIAIRKYLKHNIKAITLESKFVDEDNFINPDELVYKMLRSLVPHYIKSKLSPLRRLFYDHLKELFTEFITLNKHKIYDRFNEIFVCFVIENTNL